MKELKSIAVDDRELQQVFEKEADEAIAVQLSRVRPKYKLALARELIRQVLAGGIDYADFVSAVAVERGAKKAFKALDALPL